MKTSKYRVNYFYRWYDLWIGAYIDRDNKTVYICPLPTLGVKIEKGCFVRKLFRCLTCGYTWYEKVEPREDSLHCRKCGLFRAMTPTAAAEYLIWEEKELDRLGIKTNKENEVE